MLDILTESLLRRERVSLAKKDKSRSREKSNIKASSTFKNSLLEKVSEEYNERIDHFLEEIEDLRSELLNKPSLKIVEKYREKLGIFLRELLGHYQSHSFFRGRLGQRVEIKIWHSVDQELESLSQKIVSNHAQSLDLLAHWEALKGIVLDLKVGRN